MTPSTMARCITRAAHVYHWDDVRELADAAAAAGHLTRSGHALVRELADVAERAGRAGRHYASGIADVLARCAAPPPPAPVARPYVDVPLPL
ncbi:MAG: hypothetical protein QJR09_05145 [Micrococcus sp.]|nr:hypothetical protein [Micrococcus sp.]